MFGINYLITLYKVHMRVGAVRMLLYDCAYVQEIICSLKLVNYLPVHMHKPYNNFPLYNVATITKQHIMIEYTYKNEHSTNVAHNLKL